MRIDDFSVNLMDQTGKLLLHIKKDVTRFRCVKISADKFLFLVLLSDNIEIYEFQKSDKFQAKQNLHESR